MRSSFGQRVVRLTALAFALAPLSSLHAAAEAAAEKADAAAASSAADEKADAKPADKADASPEAKAPTAGHKSPAIAGALGFFPGVALHGAGHMYAGSWIKGLGLLAIEGAAIGIGYTTVNNSINDIQKIADGTKNGAVPTNVGTAYQAVGVGLVCSMAFLWTWFDDMAGAPIAAKEHNRLADESAGQAKLQLTPMGDGAMLALVQRF